MPKLKKYTDWGTWWDGLRTNMMKAGATSVATNLSVLISTNTVGAMGIPGMVGVGENWRTFIVGLFAQFVLHTVYAAATYIQGNQPQVVTETVDTSFVQRKPDGTQITQSSSTGTTTPISASPEVKPTATDTAGPESGGAGKQNTQL